jgi:hypothetical protein
MGMDREQIKLDVCETGSEDMHYIHPAQVIVDMVMSLHIS